MTESQQEQETPRRRFRFSMRTVLIVVTLVCVMGGLFASWQLQRAKCRAYGEKWIAMGGFVNKDASRDAEVTLLELVDNQLTEIPPEIGKLTNLNWLALSNNQLTKLPSEIENLTKLEGLYLGNNQFTDADLEQLKSLKSLEYLVLEDTNVTAEGVADLQKALPKCKIWSDFSDGLK